MHWQSEEGREVARIWGVEVQVYDLGREAAHWRIYDPFLQVNTSGPETPARGRYPITGGPARSVQQARKFAEEWVSRNLEGLQELDRLREAWTDWARHVSTHQEDADALDLMRGAWRFYESAWLRLMMS